jgi:hypothetical protein
MRKPSGDLSAWSSRIITKTLPKNNDGSYDLSFKYIDNDNDFGRNVSIVPSWVTFTNSDNTEYSTSGAITYASLMASVSPSESPTYKTLNVTKNDIEFNETQLEDLTKAGFTVFKTSIRHGVVPYEAVTFANPDSDFYLAPNIRIINAVCQNIQKAISIGSPQTLASPRDKAAAVLEQMMRNGDISDYEIDSSKPSLYAVDLKITIVPKFFTSVISSTVHVNI